jgi:hypothetical protein
MKRVWAIVTLLALLLSTSTACFADFQYTENSKVTGGAMVGMTKFLGAFSKDAKQATQPTSSTISLKGNRMRREDNLGKVEVIDLDGRRFVHIDLKTKSYSVMTFDEMRAQIEEARQKAAEQQAKRGKGQNPQVKITPKISLTPGNGTRQILNYTAKETKTRVDMEMQSQDPKPGSAAMWMTADAWIAPVKGHDELKAFYLRLAKELDWLPGAVLGANPQMNVASVELQKSNARLNGMPLLTYTSMGMGPGQAGTSGQNQQQSQPQSHSSNPVSAIGGLFGKKKKDDSAQQDSGSAAGAPASPSGSLMDITTEVTSISTSRLDAALFETPGGFKQIEAKKTK